MPCTPPLDLFVRPQSASALLRRKVCAWHKQTECQLAVAASRADLLGIRCVSESETLVNTGSDCPAAVCHPVKARVVHFVEIPRKSPETLDTGSGASNWSAPRKTIRTGETLPTQHRTTRARIVARASPAKPVGRIGEWASRSTQGNLGASRYFTRSTRRGKRRRPSRTGQHELRNTRCWRMKWWPRPRSTSGTTSCRRSRWIDATPEPGPRQRRKAVAATSRGD